MEPIKIADTSQPVDIQNSCADQSRFVCASLKHLYFEDVNLSHTRITNADMSDLEIEGAQLGGAFIRNIGMPPEGHPFHEPGARQRPLRFEHCDLNRSTFSDCDLSGVTVSGSKLEGMTINGIPVSELLRAYEMRERL